MKGLTPDLESRASMALRNHLPFDSVSRQVRNNKEYNHYWKLPPSLWLRFLHVDHKDNVHDIVLFLRNSLDPIYTPGRRMTTWSKVTQKEQTTRRQETNPASSRSHTSKLYQYFSLITYFIPFLYQPCGHFITTSVLFYFAFVLVIVLTEWLFWWGPLQKGTKFSNQAFIVVCDQCWGIFQHHTQL